MKAVRARSDGAVPTPTPAPAKRAPMQRGMPDLLTLQRVAGNAAVLRMITNANANANADEHEHENENENENENEGGTLTVTTNAAAVANPEGQPETGNGTTTTTTAVAQPTAIEPTVTIGSFTRTEVPNRPFDEPVSVLGETWPEIATAVQVDWLERAEGDWALRVGLTLDAGASWAARAPHLENVESAASPAITAATWEQAAADFTPELIERSWALRHTRFWSRALTVRHELFHVRQFEEWVRTCARPVALAALPQQRDLTVDDEEVMRAEILALAREAEDAVWAHWRAMMMPHLSYFRRPGEVAAYLDGKEEYEALAAAIRQRGATFNAAASSGGAADREEGAAVASGSTSASN